MDEVRYGGIPRAGFGVYALDSDETRRGVELALEAGYRHIDTAQSYKNEADCGLVIKESGIPRDDVFITTKVMPGNLLAGRMFGSVEQSLENLRVETVDLLLIHYPYPWDQVPMEVYLSQLVDVFDAGLATRVGISNFNIAQTQFAKSFLSPIQIATNQVEIHVFMQNRPIVNYCRDAGITLTAYCALGRGTLFGEPNSMLGPHPVLVDIAKKHSAPINQIGLAFLYHEGHVALSTSIVGEQIRSNIAANQIQLSDEDMERLRALDLNKRIVESPYLPVFD